MKAKKVNTIIKEFKNPQILGLYYNLSELFINYSASSTNIVEIFEGGWKDAEVSINNFEVSNQDDEIREFLIMGNNDCLTVFAYDEPEIKTTFTKL